MNELDKFAAVMRLGVASFIIPLLVLGSAAMFYAGRWKIGIAFLATTLFFGYLAWRNVQRVDREDNPRDERMERVNTHAAASSFWTVFNLGILLFLLHMSFGLTLNSLSLTADQIIQAAPGLFIGTMFILYMGFRAYYIKFGTESKFWRLDKWKTD
ncbi:MAG: hypothetical protein J07AB43_15700 [Candidatus Nanosalina sp. J07AB43]|nr:MAG: hypothetical protein J07AB43_15700 [Candidatus Nanosalina sp. J07AB43]